MLLPSAKHSETDFPKESLPGSWSCGTSGSLIILPILRQVFKITPVTHCAKKDQSVSDTTSGATGCFPCDRTQDKMPPPSLQLFGSLQWLFSSETQRDGDWHRGGEQWAASAVTARLQVSHRIYHGPFPVADVWDPNLVALGLMTVLLHQKADAQRIKHAPVLFQHPNLGCTLLSPRQLDPARAHHVTIPLLQHEPGGAKIVSNRRK